MPLTMIPGNREIIAILDAHVQGQYRFVHDARLPYVRVGPAHETDPITIRAGVTLKLLDHGSTQKRLQGLSSTLDFGVIDDDGPIRLGEVPWRIAALDHLDVVRRLSSAPMDDITRARPPRRVPTRQPSMPVMPYVEPKVASPTPVSQAPSLHVAPEPAPAVTPDVSIPEHFRDVCTREDLHPELGDYLVIPSTSDSASEVMPKWVVTSAHVDQMHVVKPRLKPSLGVDQPIEALGTHHGE